MMCKRNLSMATQKRYFHIVLLWLERHDRDLIKRYENCSDKTIDKAIDYYNDYVNKEENKRLAKEGKIEFCEMHRDNYIEDDDGVWRCPKCIIKKLKKENNELRLLNHELSKV